MATLHTFRTKTGMQTRRISPLRAIRLQCLECVCWQAKEVELCQSPNCSLFPFRFGTDPGRRAKTEKQVKASRRNALRLRESHGKSENAGHRTGEAMV